VSLPKFGLLASSSKEPTQFVPPSTSITPEFPRTLTLSPARGTPGGRQLPGVFHLPSPAAPVQVFSSPQKAVNGSNTPRNSNKARRELVARRRIGTACALTAVIAK